MTIHLIFVGLQKLTELDGVYESLLFLLWPSWFHVQQLTQSTIIA